MPFDVIAGKDVRDLRVTQPSFELGVWNSVTMGKALNNLIFCAVIEINDDFTQQLAFARLVLMCEPRPEFGRRLGNRVRRGCFRDGLVHRGQAYYDSLAL